MANCKYSGINIKPTDNGHLVTVHKESDGKSPMMDKSNTEEKHFPTHKEASEYAGQAMASHEKAGGFKKSSSHPVNQLKKRSQAPQTSPMDGSY